MSLIEKIRAKAQADVKTIVLPEGDEKRTVKAAEIIKKEGLAEPVLIGSPDAVAKVAAEQGADISGIKVIDPAASEKSDEYAQALFERAEKSKGRDRGRCEETRIGSDVLRRYDGQAR